MSETTITHSRNQRLRKHTRRGGEYTIAESIRAAVADVTSGRRTLSLVAVPPGADIGARLRVVRAANRAHVDTTGLVLNPVSEHVVEVKVDPVATQALQSVRDAQAFLTTTPGAGVTLKIDSSLEAQARSIVEATGGFEFVRVAPDRFGLRLLPGARGLRMVPAAA